MNQEDLWGSFPTTATEFEAMFPDEKACRRYLVEVRWGGPWVPRSALLHCGAHAPVQQTGCILAPEDSVQSLFLSRSPTGVRSLFRRRAVDHEVFRDLVGGPCRIPAAPG